MPSGLCPKGACVAGFVFAIGVLSASRVSAQQEYQGLNGSITLGGTDWRVDDDRHPTHLAGGLTVGYRLGFPWPQPAPRLTLTPHIALTATRFGGISLDTRQVAFSRVEYGLQLAARIGALRPYVLWRGGKATMERMVGTEAANFYGPGSGWGGGVELPLCNACHNAVDIAWHQSAGTFSSVDTRRDPPATGSTYRSSFFTIGWSGPFRGTRLIFACL